MADDDPPDEVAKARRLLEQGIKGSTVGQQVDKYFGTKLPPVCARLGCYVTDDGKRFYCVNASCQKHKKRDTKHSRIRTKKGGEKYYFHCPSCGSRDVEVLVFGRVYRCRSCRHEWPVKA